MKNSDAHGSINAADALRFVREAALPRMILNRGPEQRIDFDQLKAVIVGSDVVSFSNGVPRSIRQDIINCSLFAQLVASRKVSDRDNLQDWHDSYFDTLTRIGWVIQERGFTQYQPAGNDLEANRAVLQVATTLFGAGATALALVQSTLDAMQTMAAGGSWVTIFKSESQTARARRFQVTVVESGGDEEAMVGLMAFELEAKADLRQVLFFKFRSSDVSLRYASGKITINSMILQAIRKDIEQRIQDYAKSYVAELPL